MNKVLFLPDHTAAPYLPGDTLLDAALQNGIELAHECGGSCACTTCRVRIWQGMECLSAQQEPEQDRLQLTGIWQPDVRLSCQAILLGGKVTAEPLEEPQHWNAPHNDF